MQKIYTVKDLVSETHMRPFFSPTNGAAMRAFQEAASDPEHDFYKYPEDYVLYEIGEYHEDIAEVMALTKNVRLGSAKEFQNQTPEELMGEPPRTDPKKS